MIVNSFVLLDGFLCLLRLVVALFVTQKAARLWLGTGAGAPTGDARRHREDQLYLIVLGALVLLGLNLAAWPTFYGVLQSFVPHWPGVMCIYGVTRIGLGSQGAAGYLPGLLAFVQVLKPITLFASGSWLVVYLIDRRTRAGQFGRVVLGAVAAFATLTAIESACEAAYLAIPKTEQHLDVGCCAVLFDQGGRALRFLPQGPLGPSSHRWLATMFFGLHGGLAALFLGIAYRAGRGTGEIESATPRVPASQTRRAAWRGKAIEASLVLGAAFSLVVSYFYLVEIAAPRILGLAFHHCLYDMLPQAPESILGIGLLALGAFAMAWSAVARGVVGEGDSREPAAHLATRLLFVSGVAYAAALVLLTLEMVPLK